jgi:hypothetical protein
VVRSPHIKGVANLTTGVITGRESTGTASTSYAIAFLVQRDLQ